MILIRNLKIKTQMLNSVVAIGNFDGVHKGHQYVLKSGLKIAKENGKKMGVVTFEPHPKTFFLKKKSFFRLTPFRMKHKIIKELGIDYYFNLKFNNFMSEMTAVTFIKTILIEKLKVSHVITGKDFVFGKNRSGDVNLLRKISTETNNFKFFTVKDYIENNGKKYSSSELRKNLLNGEINKAKEILGRYWSISGRVIKGEKVARKLGYPTANISIINYSKLCFGVYAVNINFLKSPQNKYKGIANYGVKPTFDKKNPLLEVNIFDFNLDVYGEYIEITFKSFIRNEKKFKNLDSLKKQIRNDIKIAEQYFKNE